MDIVGAKLEIGSRATDALNRIGVTSEAVAQAVHSPDDIQKILPNGGDSRDWPVISLYLKRFSNGAEESLLLIQALKHGGTVTASAVWQIYPEDIGVSASSGALDVFKAFIEKYGVYLKTASGLTKLVMYEVVSSSTTVRNGRWERKFNLPERVFAAEDRRVTQTPELSPNKWARELNIKMHVAMLYTVNLSNYLHDLATHHAVAS